jgi:phosphate transport system permease protein
MSNPPTEPGTRKTFTGVKRRSTRQSVKVIDFIAKYVITLGGIGVTVFFAAIILFLCAVVYPLFLSAKVDKLVSVQIATPAATTQPSATTAPAATTSPTATTPSLPAKPVAMEIEESLEALWLLDSAGVVGTYRVDGGELVGTQPLSTDQPVTAVANEHGAIALGRVDGTVKVGLIHFDPSFVEGQSDVMESLNRGESIEHEGGVAMMTPAGPRVVKTVAEISEPLAVTTENPTAVRQVDYFTSDRLESFLALLDDGRLFFNVIAKKKNLMTGTETRTTDTYELPRPTGTGKPLAALLGLNGRNVFVVYPDGRCLRYDTDEPSKAYIAEEADLLPEAGATVSSVKMLLGSRTLIVTDTAGGVSGWFPAQRPDTGKDGQQLVRAHELPKQAAAVTTIATSTRDRQFVTADAQGRLVLRHMTSGATAGVVQTDSKSPVVAVAMSPKNDAVVALSANNRFTLYHVDNPHPDAGFTALFRPVHYEGYADAGYVWQSSAATDDAEAKFSLIPLIFGTIKATFYALLFAIPVAIAAAIYTSEFMQPRVRAVVKPVVEMMASLPSVVLGFIAALVLAPFIEETFAAVLLAFASIPVGMMLFGFIWQTLPPQVTRELPVWVPFATMIFLVAACITLGFAFGPTLESLLFFGDFRGWVGRRVGNAVPGWVCLLTPIFAVVMVILFNSKIRRQLPIYQNGVGTRLQIALFDLARFTATGLLAFVLAYAAGHAFNAIGLDLRDDWMAGALRISPIGGYTQRNTFIIGMIMGFAIIPIIYTVSEDALSSVPGSLRSAALGAGATPWQTAIRVVLPVAISGIFSACMIGLGRAAGETMIVLMAGGNTAVLDANIFNGVRTLSANIATELPEAPVHSTHYRILFLSALVLFVLTFIVNTSAEMIRIRFRKRAYQL